MSNCPRYEASFECHPDALVISVEGMVCAVNGQAERLFGYSREELVGRPLCLVLPGAARPGVCHRKDGSAFPAEIDTRTLPDAGLLTVVRTATGIRASEQALMDARQLNEDVFKSSQVGIIVMDRNLRYLAWNPKMEEISGLRPDEVLGKHPLELFPFLQEAGADQLLRRALDGEILTSPDFPFAVPEHGRRGWSSQTVGPLRNAKGEIVGVIASVSDVTVRKQTEDALREISARLINAQEEERKRLARELHDDLSQQIGSLSIETSSLKRQIPEEHAEAREQSDRIHQGLVHLSETVRRMSHELHPAVLQYSGLVAALRSYCQEFWRLSGVQVAFGVRVDSVALEEFEPSRLAFESVAAAVALCLYRVAQEALRNVAKHARVSQASVELERGGGILRLVVSDSGLGMDTSRTTQPGLGLLNIRERTRLVGGKVDFRSSPGQGTTIIVEVPEPCPTGR